MEEKCPKCSRTVNAGVFCKKCKSWYHNKCERVTAGQKQGYMCKKCKKQEGKHTMEVSHDQNSIDNPNTSRETALQEKLSTLEKENSILTKTVANLQQQVATLTQELAHYVSEKVEQDKQIHDLKVLCDEANNNEWQPSGRSTPKSNIRSNNHGAISTANRYQALDNQSDEEIKTPLVPTNPPSLASKPKLAKSKRVLILADSQGRNCSDKLANALGSEYEVTGIIKPGATYQTVTNSVQKLCEDFNENDTVIVLAGTNDIFKCNDNDVLSAVVPLVKLSEQTKVILNPIPHRYDNENANYEIDYLNEEMHKRVNSCTEKNSKNLQINFDVERMSRFCFTRHGLHFTNHGKDKLVEQWSRRILNFSGPIRFPTTG